MSHVFSCFPARKTQSALAKAQSRCWKVPKLQVARARQRGSGFGHGLAFGIFLRADRKREMFGNHIMYSLVELS